MTTPARMDPTQAPFPRALLAAKPGDLIEVTRDNRNVERRAVTREPWQLGNGHWVIGLEGIAGGYSLSRCRLAEGDADEPGVGPGEVSP